MVEAETEPLTYENKAATLSVGGAGLDLTEPRPLKLTVNDLVLLDRHWHDDDHKSTELINGRIYFTPAHYIPRCRTAQEIWIRLREAAVIVAPHLFVGMRGSIEISLFDLPLPDIVLTSEAHGEGFIPVASVPLVVEVAETALDFFMGDKMRLYARAGISEYWVADVSGRVLYQMWTPGGANYTERIAHSFGDGIETRSLKGLAITIPSS